jgi:hypothetical protein
VGVGAGPGGYANRWLGDINTVKSQLTCHLMEYRAVVALATPQVQNQRILAYQRFHNGADLLGKRVIKASLMYSMPGIYHLAIVTRILAAFAARGQ